MKTRKIVRFILKTELVEHFIAGLTQAVCMLLILNATTFAQIPKTRVLSNQLYGFTLPEEILKQPSGRNTKKAEDFYEDLWKTPRVIKNLYEVGSMSETAFLVQFTTNVSDSDGIAYVNSMCMKHFGLHPKVSTEKFKRKARLAFAMIVQNTDGKEFVEVQFDIDFPLARRGSLSEFSSDLLDAIEADDEVEVYLEPNEDHPHTFIVRMPQKKFADIKELIIDHLEKSGYEVVIDQ